MGITFLSLYPCPETNLIPDHAPIDEVEVRDLQLNLQKEQRFITFIIPCRSHTQKYAGGKSVFSVKSKPRNQHSCPRSSFSMSEQQQIVPVGASFNVVDDAPMSGASSRTNGPLVELPGDRVGPTAEAPRQFFYINVPQFHWQPCPA